MSLATAMASSDTNYKQTVWGIAAQDYYVNLTSFTVTKPEWLAIGSSQYVTIVATPSNATWKTASNFIWTSDNPSVATVNDSGRVTGVSTGYAKITANHKMTNCTYSYYVMVGQVISNGTYYIQNTETRRYMDLEGPSTTEGRAIQQWNFHTGSQGKWIITYSSDGYYYIRSQYNNRYVGVLSGSTSSGAAIVQTATASDACKWKIVMTPTGNYKFVVKSAETNNMVISVPLAYDSNGTDLVQLSYSNNANYKDEWNLKEILYTYDIKHYYDNGYDVRFDAPTTNITEYQYVCSQILLELFGIGMTSTVQLYTSCADTCTGTPVTMSNTTESCSALHLFVNHKSSNKIRSDLTSQYGNGTNLLTRVAWTGHVLESGSSNSNSNSHTIVMAIGMVTDESNNNLSDNVIRYERIYTLLHESSHQLGAPDHYCYDETSSNCNNPSHDCWRCDRGLAAPPICLMTYRMSDLENRLSTGNLSSIYCSQCMSSTHSKGILTHLNDHHD